MQYLRIFKIQSQYFRKAVLPQTRLCGAPELMAWLVVVIETATGNNGVEHFECVFLILTFYCNLPLSSGTDCKSVLILLFLQTSTFLSRKH